MSDAIKDLQERLEEVAEERDWNQVHSPKNRAMALAGEVGELLELFQWLSEEESKALVQDEAELARAREELADVFVYVLRLADKLDIDLIEAAQAKIALNAAKYPVELAKGNAVKYDRRGQ